MSPKFPGKAVNWNDGNSCFDKAPPVLQSSDLSSLNCRKSPQIIPLITLGMQDSPVWSKTSSQEGGWKSLQPSQCFPAAQDAQIPSKGTQEQQVFPWRNPAIDEEKALHESKPQRTMRGARCCSSALAELKPYLNLYLKAEQESKRDTMQNRIKWKIIHHPAHPNEFLAQNQTIHSTHFQCSAPKTLLGHQGEAFAFSSTN